MAYSGVSSIEDVAKGAEAMTSIMAQPAMLEQKKAEASSATSKAIEEKAKAGYEVKRYGALEEFMKGPSAGSMGKTSYEIGNEGQELSQAKAQLQQEEANLKGLAPEDRKNLDAHLDRMQGQIDKKEAALLTKASKQMGQVAAIYSNINSPESLEQARGFLKPEVEAKADAAIRDGKLPADKREAFISDQMKQVLPEKWDNKTSPQFIATKRDTMLSAKEQTDNRNEQNRHIQAMASMKRAENEAIRASNLSLKVLASGDARAIGEERKSLYNAVQSNQGLIKDEQNTLAGIRKDIENTPDTVPGEGFFSSKVKNPQKTVLEERAKESRAAITSLINSNKTLATQLATLSHRTGERPNAGIKPPPPVDIVTVGKETYERPSDMSDADWTAYKQAVAPSEKEVKPPVEISPKETKKETSASARTPSTGDIQMLPNRPTPEAISSFDETYGQGSARKLIKKHKYGSSEGVGDVLSRYSRK